MIPAADVTAEYLALRRHAGIVVGTHGVVWVEGADARSFLEGMLSASIGEETGRVRRSLLLTPQGRLRAHLHVLPGEERVGLVADAGVVETVVDDLARFRIRVDVVLSIEPRPLLVLWGPAVDGVLEAAGLAPAAPGTWRDGAVAVADLPTVHGTVRRVGLLGTDVAALVAAGGRTVGAEAYTAVRIEAGEPVVGVDVDEGTIPQESGLVPGAVDFDKGCYLGQELVARIASRGHVNRHLRGVVLEEAVLPPVGAEVVDGERPAGTITSVAESLDRRAPVALGLLRREVDPGARVTVRWPGGTASARVEGLPLC